ncbi:MAG: acylphosphatase [Lentisphaeraceae bacterium]|nr:acylphosphatase [Lentisphaeraceae bacterium]
MLRFHILVSGRVQGVGYRYFAEEKARRSRVSGWVKNLPDGRVEAEIQGQEGDLLELISILRKGPPLGIVKDIVKYEVPLEEKDNTFCIRY